MTICGLFLLSCNEGTKTAPKEDSLYETLEISLSDRTLTTGYSAAISGVQTVEIRPQVSGMITDILIEEGENVRKGQVLFVIDQTPYKAAYEIAVANVKSAEAALSTAELILKSNRDLYNQDVVSEFDLMTAQNDLTEAQARLALCKAEEVNASNNLSYTEVRSPVNGVASMIPYRVGALVSSSITQPLVTVVENGPETDCSCGLADGTADRVDLSGMLVKVAVAHDELDLRHLSDRIVERSVLLYHVEHLAFRHREICIDAAVV